MLTKNRKRKQKIQLAKNGKIMVIQKYMESPLLIDKRKFDIRAYVLCTDFEPEGFRAYFFPLIYIRTSAVKYNIKNLDDKLIHLVNDAVQKKGEGYSEKGSNKEACKMSQLEFETWVSRNLNVDCHEVEAKLFFGAIG